MKDKAIKILVPLVALVVIIESLLLLTKKGPESKITGPVNLPESSGRSVQMSWEASLSPSLGVAEEVVLKLAAPEKVILGAVDMYIKYDPTKVMVSELEIDKNFVKPSFSKVSQEKGIVVANYWISESDGFDLDENGIELARLKVNYLSEGPVMFEVGEGTLVVENGSAKVLPFISESLEVNVNQ